MRRVFTLKTFLLHYMETVEVEYTLEFKLTPKLGFQ